MLKNCKSNIGKEVVEEYYTTEYWPVIGRNVKYKVVKYTGVNKHNVDYDKNSEIVKKFLSNIKVLFADSNDEDLMEEIA